MDPKVQTNNLSIPGAIVVAGLLIAIGIFASRATPVSTVKKIAPAAASINLKAVSASEHVLGNPNADVVIVEYSDPSCPYCKIFQPTMETIMNTYGKAGEVAWVYRHFPLDKPNQNGDILHPNAGHEAEAFECAATLSDNNVFWNYEKAWYGTFPLQGATDRSVASDTAQLTQIAQSVGIDGVKFTNCLSSGVTAKTVEADFQDGIAAGANGTPYNVMVLKKALSSGQVNTLNDYIATTGLASNVWFSTDNKKIAVNGALSIETMKKLLDTVLEK